MDTLAPARISASGTRKKPNQPWYSQALKILQRRYRQKERCWKLSLCEAERVDLKLALNSFKEACRVAKSDYFTRKISEAANSSRELFRTVNGGKVGFGKASKKRVAGVQSGENQRLDQGFKVVLREEATNPPKKAQLVSSRLCNGVDVGE
ncbi:hypothetical protein NDU88_008930 [Pleurodeles waltl]|uniref:Uncharacterized protein n=1 Tax=Pleurodeles waltl TaxID=8319 RepID=A0AAV7NEI5_PLEWA|nr:hypothetical protein NDU88_008930 [Pleurodeles waltl]